MTPIRCIRFNPRPHLGGGGATPQVVFLAEPNSVSERADFLRIAAFLTFLQEVLNLKSLWFMGCDLVLEVMSRSYFHFESYLNNYLVYP